MRTYRVIVNLPGDTEAYEIFGAPDMQSVQNFIDAHYPEWTSLVITVAR